MSESHLLTHCGARVVAREDLEKVPTPPATSTWFPLGHVVVVDEVCTALQSGGFAVRTARYALSRSDARLFCTIDLESCLGHGVSLAVGVRNSTDKSLPLGFCAGSKVFVCDNMAFRSELLVSRKHTRFGLDRFREAIAAAVQSLQQFRDAEEERIRRFRLTDVGDERAESFILRAFEQSILSYRVLPDVLAEWRKPSFEEFHPRNLWSLFNAFTTALAPVQRGNPQRFADLTMRLHHLIDTRLEFAHAV